MNFVALVGRIHDPKGSVTRHLEVIKPNSAENLFIPCRYWTPGVACALSSLEDGTLISARGRIDSDKELGLYVIIEGFMIVK